MRSLFDEPELQEVTSELGIFGSVLGTSEDGGKLLHNSTDGFLVRSKVLAIVYQFLMTTLMTTFFSHPT